MNVKGIGPIAFPISQKTAKALIKESHLAPFGWRDQTIVDTQVRNVWEVPKSKIKIAKRNFTKVMGPVLEAIQLGLDLDPEGELCAELHNMVVYEKGQFFSGHQDSEKSDAMVATMVVVLPSVFKGGTLVVDQQGNKQSFRAPVKVGKDLRVISFYADCHHEVKKVTSGYRIVLTYNLNFKAPSSVTPSACSPMLVRHIKNYFRTEQASESLRYDAHPRWLVYLMDHQYSQKGLSWSQLKGPDRRRAGELCAAADELDLVAHLALTDVHEIWQAEDEFETSWNYQRYRYVDDESEDYVDEGDDEDRYDERLVELIDDDYTLAHWIDRKGKRASFKPHPAPQEMICWNKANDELKPFESSYEGYMGNHGNTVDRWYHRAAVVLWPKSQIYSSQFCIDPISTLKKITKLLLKDSKLGSKT
ncbi:MAG: 2OG-Fe(II) oxygenase, partial [Gammaproteobacteria bacterium]